MRTTELRTVTTRDLEVAYVERGPRGGTPVFLWHGFPDDAQTWDHLAATLAADGYRTIAPFVRGFGPTRFRGGIAKTGEVAALARDVLALADALDVGEFHYIGHDWGARAGFGAAVLAPARLRSLTALAVAHGTNYPGQAMDIEQTRAYWYQWYFATPRGADELERNRHAFCRALWSYWSPGWRFTDSEYDATAASFENPDFVEITLSSYRQRWGFVPGADAYADDRKLLANLVPITVPTLCLMGRDDGVTLASSVHGKEALFAAPYRVEFVEGAGHFLHRERPDVIAERVREHIGAYQRV
jgi:pimeloyl-ACP methyl ester carboxylesterase